MMNSTIESADGRKSLMEYSEVKNYLKTISELIGLSEAEIGNV